MEKRSMFRRILALLAAALVWLAALPWSAMATREPEGGYRRLTDPAELVSGTYVLVDGDGMAPLAYDAETGWITPAQPVLDTDTVTDSLNAVWSLTVAEGGVFLRDANGVSIAPGPDGGNGITAGEYLWTLTWNGGAFSFHGTSGDTPVTLARNGDSGYRAVRDALIEGYPEGYPSGFSLYLRAAEETVPETTMETTAEPTSTATEETTSPTTQETTMPAQTEETTEATEEGTQPTETETQPTEVPTQPAPELAAGDYVIWSSADGVALSSRRVSEGSRYYAGTRVTLTDGSLIGQTAAEVWSLAWEGEACILCSGEETLGTSREYAGISYGTENTRWLAEEEGTGWYLKNAATGTYVRYAPDFSCWTSANSREDATLLAFSLPGQLSQPQDPTEPEEETQSTQPAPELPGPVGITPDGGEMLPGAVTLTCETPGAEIWYAVSRNGEAYGEDILYQSPIPLSSGFGACTIRAWAQTSGGTRSPVTERRFTEVQPRSRGLYFGKLHVHSDISGGSGSPRALYAQAAEIMDFLVITDPSEAFDNAPSARLTQDAATLSADWVDGREAAKEATGRDFVGIFGFELAWPQAMELGHISTLDTPGFAGREAFSDLPQYYDALAAAGAIGQFNHPGTLYGDFQDFAHYSSARDQAMQLIELGSGGDAWYIRALDRGWHLAPTAGNWGSRTALLAETLTEEGLYAAIRSRRVYATQDWDLAVTFTLDNAPMGSILAMRDVDTQVHIRVTVSDPTDGSDCRAAVVSGGGEVLWDSVLTDGLADISLPTAASYYYLRISQPDGDMAITAPIWIEGEEQAGILAFTADDSQPQPGQTVNLTLTIQNKESAKLDVERIDFFREDIPFYSIRQLAPVNPGETASCTAPLIWDGTGNTQVRVLVTASLGGHERTYEQTLTLHYSKGDSAGGLYTIGDARRSEAGTACTLRGFVTAGSGDPNNTFPNTIYLQDNTGGIAVVGISGPELAIGIPLEVTGTLGRENGDPVLEVLSWKLLEGDSYRYVAESLTLAQSQDLLAYGGKLVKLEGTVVSVTSEDGVGVSWFVLRDSEGNQAAVAIESAIRSGSTGRNELAHVVKTGRTVRATGFLYRTPGGEIALRVRNCDEVIYVPSLPYASAPPSSGDNPKTGEDFNPFFAILPLSLAVLFLLWPRQKQQ